MSHEISIRENGQAEAMYAVTPAWHSLGRVLTDAPTSEVAFKQALLDWEVATSPIYVKGIGDNGQDTYTSVKEKRATVRTDTNAVLGIVSKNYTPFQNAEAFSFMDKLVGSGQVKYESAGALKGGKLIWLLAQLNVDNDKIVDGDDLKRYLLMFAGHDGLNAINVIPTSVRVVCWNTLNIAAPGMVRDDTSFGVKGNKMKNVLRMKHSSTLKMKLEDAQKVLGLVNGRFDAFTDEARKLAQIKITQAQFDSFVERLIPVPITGKDSPQRVKVRAVINDIYNNGKEQEMVRGTAWAAINSVTDYIDHVWEGKSKNPAKRADNTLYSRWFGQAGGFKQEAQRTAVEMFV
jgi:phage/plasmid-like protein (TIGR03299 family)